MSELRVNNITNRDGQTGTIVAGIASVTSTSHFVPPSGTTAERGSRGRGLFAGGATPTYVDTIDYITIATTGNASDFGNLTATSYDFSGGASSSTRALFAGGYRDPSYSNIIDYVTISATGNAFDFGDLTRAKYETAAVSSQVRGILAGGYAPINGTGTYLSEIDFVTIASLGNASNFGNLAKRKGRHSGCGSPTRGVFSGGYSPGTDNIIQYITIATTGDAQDFGDLTDTRTWVASCSNSIRGVSGGGAGVSNVIDYITIASLGNAIDFGDLTTARRALGAASSTVRGIFAGGLTPTVLNTIDYVTIASIGNATDFGDLTQARHSLGGCSDSHGGLG